MALGGLKQVLKRNIFSSTETHFIGRQEIIKRKWQ